MKDYVQFKLYKYWIDQTHYMGKEEQQSQFETNNNNSRCVQQIAYCLLPYTTMLYNSVQC